jgi:Ribbon-helix-helix protein, copG family
MKVVSTKIDDTLEEELTAKAKEMKVSVSEVLRLAVTAYLRETSAHGQASPGMQRYLWLLEEVLITRSIILRMADKSIGRELTDKLLDVAVKDAAAAMAQEK